MARVLIVDDVRPLPSLQSLQNRRVRTSRTVYPSGNVVPRGGNVDLIQLSIPGITGLDLIREFRRTKLPIEDVSVTNLETADATSAPEAIAANILGRRISASGVASDTDSRAINTEPQCASHASSRWAAVIVKTIDANDDPTTLHKWARVVGASPGAIRNWCRTAGLSARCSLKFARLLRAVVRNHDRRGAEELLDCVDKRTLTKLLNLGNSAARHSELPATLEEFLECQRWITSSIAVRAVRSELHIRRDAHASRVRAEQ